LIFFSAKKLSQNEKFSAYFNQIVGLLLLFFSLYSLNASFSLLGLPNFSIPQKVQSQENFSNLLKMTATSTGYSPNYFRVKAGQNLRWEIADMGTSGCTNAILAPSLFKGPLNLVPGTTSIKEFTAPTTPGRYRFSCWMGMISGTIEVIN
jgi:plastocyanin domain-containing protein